MTKFNRRLPQVRVSPKQLEQIKKMAERLQMKKSEVIREAIRRMAMDELGVKDE